MREYPGQPLDNFTYEERSRYIIDIVKEVLEDDLPNCGVNEWFIESVHFANMLDKIESEIRRGFGR